RFYTTRINCRFGWGYEDDSRNHRGAKIGYGSGRDAYTRRRARDGQAQNRRNADYQRVGPRYWNLYRTRLDEARRGRRTRSEKDSGFAGDDSKTIHRLVE